MSDIDWSVELRKIEREFDGLPPERTRSQIRLEKIQEITAKQQFDERLTLIGIWAQLVLVGLLAIGLFWWPYQRDCGFPAVAFIVSHVMVIIGGMSIAVRAWRDRLAWPFAGATLFIAIAWTIVALHTFPRLGLSTLPTTTTGWSCRG